MATHNNGFFDLPADERAQRAEAAMELAGVDNLFDLEPEERAYVYEQCED